MAGEFTPHHRETVLITESGEPQIIAQVAYIHADGTEVDILRLFADAQGLSFNITGPMNDRN